MSLLVLTLVVLPFIAINIWATRQAYSTGQGTSGSQEKQEKHLIAFRYLFYRFRPDLFWWGMPLNIRQLLLAFAPVLTPDDPSAQVIYVVSILIVYLAATCYFWPWKSHELNVLDVVSVAILSMLMVAVSTVMPAAQPGGWHHAVMLALAVCLVVMGSAFFALTLCMLACRGVSSDFGFASFSGSKLSQLSSDLHRLAEILAALPPEHCKSLLERMNTYDLRGLSGAIGCIQAASRCEIWVSDLVERRLIAVEHSKASIASFENLKSSIKRSSSRLSGGATKSPDNTGSGGSNCPSGRAGFASQDCHEDCAGQEATCPVQTDRVQLTSTTTSADVSSKA